MFRFKDFDASKQILSSENTAFNVPWACESELSTEEKAELINEYDGRFFKIRDFLLKLIEEDGLIKKKRWGGYNLSSLQKWLRDKKFECADNYGWFDGKILCFKTKYDVKNLYVDTRLFLNQDSRSIESSYQAKNLSNELFSEKGVNEVFHRMLWFFCEREREYAKKMDKASYATANAERIDSGKRACASLKSIKIEFEHGEYVAESHWDDSVSYSQAKSVSFNPFWQHFGNRVFESNEHGELVFKQWVNGEVVYTVLSKDEADKVAFILDTLKDEIAKQIAVASKQLEEVINK